MERFVDSSVCVSCHVRRGFFCVIILFGTHLAVLGRIAVAERGRDDNQQRLVLDGRDVVVGHAVDLVCTARCTAIIIRPILLGAPIHHTEG